MTQVIKRAAQTPALNQDWEDSSWKTSSVFEVDSFLPQSSEHRPQTRVKLLYDEVALYVRFAVQDRYVISRRCQYQDMVCNDSCVEIFVEPKSGSGYFNFEMNAGGTMLLYHISDHTRTETAFEKYEKVPWDLAKNIEIYHSLPDKIEEEIADEVEWHLCLAIPWTLFEHFVGDLGEKSGQTIRANLFKCSEESSKPHWASFAPVPEFNFHLPQCFVDFQLE